MDKETKDYIDEEIAKALNKVQALTLKIQLDHLNEKKQAEIKFNEFIERNAKLRDEEIKDHFNQSKF